MIESILHWDLEQDSHDTGEVFLRSRAVSDIRVSLLRGRRCRGWRTAEHGRRDGGSYVGIVCKLEGREICQADDRTFTIEAGDVFIWRNDADIRFKVEEWATKVVMIVPESRVDALLHQAVPKGGNHMRGGTALAALTSSFMSTLGANLERFEEHEAELAVEMALDMVGSIGNYTDEASQSLRCSLYERILRYIDANLEDTDLTPPRIAAAQGISTRYLHLLFANRGQTVAGWIRERRLLQCREEVEQSRRGLSLTEIAHRWGFSDGAHFSRSFKRRFGLPPKSWRDQYSAGGCG